MSLLMLNAMLIPIVLVLVIFLAVMKRKIRKIEEERRLMEPVEQLEKTKAEETIEASEKTE
ncbi:MAG: hypothetical protein U0K95_01620 [Eubacterium sp.]|nr:hypothetical protein [Eubacterium sp.]